MRVLQIVVVAICALALGFWLGRSHERVVTVTSTTESWVLTFPCADGSTLVIPETGRAYKVGGKRAATSSDPDYCPSFGRWGAKP